MSPIDPPSDPNLPERRRTDGRRKLDQQGAQIRRWLEDMTADTAHPTYVRVAVVARYFDVNRKTVKKWDGAGLLMIRHFPKADRIALSDVLAFKEKHHPSTSTVLPDDAHQMPTIPAPNGHPPKRRPKVAQSRKPRTR